MVMVMVAVTMGNGDGGGGGMVLSMVDGEAVMVRWWW